MDVSELIELNELARKDGEKFSKKRFAFKSIANHKYKAMVGLAGLRGVGKTVVLRQILASNPNAFYISLDAIEPIELFKTAKFLKENYGVKTLLLDEIHYLHGWRKELKKIYDFLNLKVYFTGSVAIELVSSVPDLSRRVSLHYLHPFSFREYLYFHKGLDLPKWTARNTNKLFEKTYALEKFWGAYAHGGLLPCFEDEQTIVNIVERVVSSDLMHAANLNASDVLHLKNLLKFLASSPPDGASYSSISKNIGITKYKAIQYCSLLEKAFLLNVIQPRGTNVLKEPKILFSLPFRKAYAPNGDWLVGALREEFFVDSLKFAGVKPRYLKTKRGEKTPDYWVELNGKPWIIEVGGKGKTIKQLKGVRGKKTIAVYPGEVTGKKIPLSLFGFLA